MSGFMATSDFRGYDISSFDASHMGDSIRKGEAAS